MTPSDFLLTLLSGLIRSGLSLKEAAETEIGLYLKVLAFSAAHTEDKRHDERPRENVVEMRRGFIDEVF